MLSVWSLLSLCRGDVVGGRQLGNYRSAKQKRPEMFPHGLPKGYTRIKYPRVVVVVVVVVVVGVVVVVVS